MKTILVTSNGLKRSFVTDVVDGQILLFDAYSCEKGQVALYHSQSVAERKQLIQKEIDMYHRLYEDSKHKDKETGKSIENTGKSHFQHMLRGVKNNLAFLEELEKTLA
jgi:hypothetical protein